MIKVLGRRVHKTIHHKFFTGRISSKLKKNGKSNDDLLGLRYFEYFKDGATEVMDGLAY